MNLDYYLTSSDIRGKLGIVWKNKKNDKKYLTFS